MLYAKFQFFVWCGFRDTEVQNFVFSIWLPHHVTCDVIIIIKTCYMSCRANVENFCLNPTSGCREKHESSVWTNKQTYRDRQTDRQSDRNAIPSLLVKVINDNFITECILLAKANAQGDHRGKGVKTHPIGIVEGKSLVANIQLEQHGMVLYVCSLLQNCSSSS